MQFLKSINCFLFGCNHECILPETMNIQETSEIQETGTMFAMLVGNWGNGYTPHKVKVDLFQGTQYCKHCNTKLLLKKYRHQEWEIATPNNNNLIKRIWKNTETPRNYILWGGCMSVLLYISFQGLRHGVYNQLSAYIY